MGLVDMERPRRARMKSACATQAIGVNFIDTYHRGGLYKIPLPSGLGLEAAGIVDAIGEGVTRFALGDRVAYCTGPIGAYAEAHVVREARAVKLPDAIAFDIAAASLLKGMTARYLLRKTFRVEPGHWLLDPRGRRRRRADSCTMGQASRRARDRLRRQRSQGRDRACARRRSCAGAWRREFRAARARDRRERACTSFMTASARTLGPARSTACARLA